MGTHYSNGSYGEALNVARDLEIEIKDIMGSDNAVHASCINNIGKKMHQQNASGGLSLLTTIIGLMLKMLGKLQPAMDHYEKALAMYEKAVGTHHMSYYSTLANIGVLCKTMSEGSNSPEDYESYLNRAEESLTTAIKGQRELAGKSASH
jgi:tetratricopeptide (TPR) repeat protein